MPDMTKRKSITSDYTSIRHPLLAGFLAFVAYYIVFQAFYNKIAEGEFYPYTDLYDFLLYGALNFFTILIIFIADVSIIFRYNRLNGILWKILVDFLLTNCAVIIVNTIHLLVFTIPFNGTLNWTGTIFNNFILFFVIESAYYIIRYQRKSKEAEMQEQVALRYRYNALKAQISPHFLFNSLNILSALSEIDGRKEKEFIRWLAHVYHYILAKQDAELASVDEELAFMDSYASILALRFKDKFSLTVEGRGSVSHKKLPPYTLQLLIENITKHNTISSRLPMEVNVVIGHDGVSVSNPIHPRVSESASHLGLRYLSELYASFGLQFQTINDGSRFTAFAPFIP